MKQVLGLSHLYVICKLAIYSRLLSPFGLTAIVRLTKEQSAANILYYLNYLTLLSVKLFFMVSRQVQFCLTSFTVFDKKLFIPTFFAENPPLMIFWLEWWHTAFNSYCYFFNSPPGVFLVFFFNQKLKCKNKWKEWNFANNTLKKEFSFYI